jgi:primary-amine oxidase
MRTPTMRLAVIGASALVLPALFPGGTATAARRPAATALAASAAAPACTSRGIGIGKKLPNGTTWTMCWRFSNIRGLVLEDIAYRPKKEPAAIKVLSSAALAQVNVPYDSGETEYNDLSDIGFGNTAIDIGPEECPGGTVSSVYIPDARRNVKALCVMTRSRGFAYRSDIEGERGDSVKKYSKQGDDLVVFSISQLGWYEYVTQWNFSDDGTITAKEGATGDLSPGDYSGKGTGWPIGKGNHDYSANHYHSVFWRLSFALDGSREAKVEQYDTKRTGRGPGSAILTTTRRSITKESAGTSALRRWWRVVSTAGKNADGHARSWQLVQEASDHYEPHRYTSKDVYFTQYRACEKLASGNSDPSCPRSGGTSVDKWVNGQSLTRPVVWVNVGFHHTPRDEDQTPMPIHWQGFQLVPRDVTAMSPLTPDELAGNNGQGH